MKPIYRDGKWYCECGRELDCEFIPPRYCDCGKLIEWPEEEADELEKRVVSIERHMTYMCVFFGFYFLMRTAEIVIDWFR